jgi:hypothetical protein
LQLQQANEVFNKFEEGEKLSLNWISKYNEEIAHLKESIKILMKKNEADLKLVAEKIRLEENKNQSLRNKL